MRDLSHDRALISINSMTVKAWSLVELVEGCARAGLSAISPWRDIVQACGAERAGQLIRAHGMTVTGLCRGGMFPAADATSRRAAVFPSLVPGFTLLIGFLTLGEVPSLAQLAGFAIVLAGFRLTQKS